MSRTGREKGTQVVMVAPLVAALLFFTILPLAFAVLVSFTDLRLNRLARWDWIGFEHYVRLATDARWWTTVKNGMIYIVVPTALQMFLLALLVEPSWQGETPAMGITRPCRP